MRWLIACFLLVSSSFTQAEGAVYGEVQVAAAGVEHSNLDFYPVFGSVSAGVFVVPGIGIELFADSNISSDRTDGFDLEVEDAYGIAARFQSPPVNNVQGYIVVGMVQYNVNQQAVGQTGAGDSRVSEEFSGARVSLGLMQRLKRLPGLLVSVEYRHYNAGEPLRVDALMLGLRVNTP